MPDGYMLSAQRNGVRLPAYSRLDLRADRTFTYRKSRLTLFMEVVNAINRDNFRPNSPGFNTHHAPGVRADREAVSVAAGGGSADRVLGGHGKPRHPGSLTSPYGPQGLRGLSRPA